MHYIMIDPIDCKSDPCHLAWLVRDNRHLLASISGGKCSDGTELKNLDPETICQVYTYICKLK